MVTFIRKLLRKAQKKNTIHSDYIIPRSQHHVSKTEISPNALTVLNRLNGAGFDAYLVGGSVRDLLLRKSPKDFDVATNATPPQIRKLFKNARIIGRRFKLVHILYGREIIEVATFRGNESTESSGQADQTEHAVNAQGMLVRDNIYGTLEEDAWRRDFSINSLYYDVRDSSIVDYTGGFADIQNKTLRIIGDAKTRYQEDPVRILRAIRFSAKLNFDIEAKTASPLKEAIALLDHVSTARLFDEIAKLYQCGRAQSVQEKLIAHGIFERFFPQTHTLFNSKYPVQKLIELALESTDSRVNVGKPVIPTFLFAILLWFPFIQQKARLEKQTDAQIEPINALEQSMSLVLKIQNERIAISKRHAQVIREIWFFQYRLQKRSSRRAEELLHHPRFRAAYDFLALRALAGDESTELAEWWTEFQDASLNVRQKMIAEQRKKLPKSKARAKNKKTK